MDKETLILIKRRYFSHRARCSRLKIELPKEEEYILLFEHSFSSGFTCSYCGKKMLLKDVYPYRNLVSVDHCIPVTSGGSSRLENLCLCCVECNIMKGTMSANTFIRLMEKIRNDPKLRDDMFNEWFQGKFANKMERCEYELHDKEET